MRYISTSYFTFTFYSTSVTNKPVALSRKHVGPAYEMSVYLFHREIYKTIKNSCRSRTRHPYACRLEIMYTFNSTAGEPGKTLFFLSCKQRTISPIIRRQNFTKFEHNTSIGVAMKTLGTEFCKFYRKGSFFSKNANSIQKILTSCDFGSP